MPEETTTTLDQTLPRPNAKRLFEDIIAQRLPSMDTIWSTVELGIAESEYQSLILWFQHLSYMEWESIESPWMHPPVRDPQRASLDEGGLLIIVLFAEHARRHAKENNLWSCINHLLMTVGLRDSFFSANGQPTSQLKRIIESAACHWKLRHVFDIPGHMAWFVTIYLQMGFTKWGMERRLPFWLSGQMQPVAVSYLLARGEMGSPSFHFMWSALRAYRLNHITEVKCRQILEANPWICQSWIPTLLKQARARLDLIERDISADAENLEPLILDEPKLIWRESEDPFFQCEILAVTTFELEAECYEIRSSAFESVRLIRKEDGNYYVTGGNYIEIPFSVASLQCTLVEQSSSSGELDRLTQVITFWDRHYPISLYQKSNGAKMLDPETPTHLDQGCYAIFHHSFSIQPEPRRSFETGGWWMVELPPCQGEGLALLQEGERVWWPATPSAIGQTPCKAEVYSASNEVIEWQGRNDQPRVRFYIRVPEGASLNWVRIGHQVVDFEDAGASRYKTTLFNICPEHLVYPLYATVGFTIDGKRHRCSVRIHLKAQVCILEKDANLSVYNPERALNIRNARRFLFHILTPEEEHVESREVYLLEGARFLKRVGKRGLQLSDLAGYGAPIEIYKGLYNTQQRIMTLVTRVRDMGAIRSIIFSEEGFQLQTCSPIDIGEEHQLVAWTADHQFVELPIENLKKMEEDNEWFYSLANITDSDGEGLSIKAIGFFYQGHRVGSWFDLTFHFTITQIETEEEAERCAEMLRWFKAPILDEERGSAMSYLLKKFMGAVMPVWLETKASPRNKFAPLPVDDEWLQAVSTLGRRISLGQLTLVDASQIIEAVAPDFDPVSILTSFPEALEKLDGLNAGLIAKIVYIYLSELPHLNIGVSGHELKTAILKSLEVANADFEIFCEKLGVDERFIGHTLDSILQNPRPNELERHNRELLLRHRLIRRMLTRRYIQTLNI